MAFVFYVNWIPTAIPNDIFPSLVGSFKALPYVFIVWTAVGLIWYFVIKVDQARGRPLRRHLGRRVRPGRRRGGGRPPRLTGPG